MPEASRVIHAAAGVAGVIIVASSDSGVEMSTNGNAGCMIDSTGSLLMPGSLNETHLYAQLIKDPAVKEQPVERIMQPAFPFVDISTPVDLLATMLTPASPAVLVRDFKTEKTFIITRSDVIRLMC
jgi:predicted transcriptional regulator